MSNYRHILVAIDLLPNSKKTLAKAMFIAEQNQATVSLAHVLEHSPLAYGGEFSIPIDANLEESLEHEAGMAMTKLAKTFNIPESNVHLESGSVKLAITELAKEIKTDLIIVGSHSHHGINSLLGSRANAILHVAQCDVWVVKND